MGTDHRWRIVLVTAHFRIKIATYNQYIAAMNFNCDITKRLVESAFIRVHLIHLLEHAQLYPSFWPG